jgi:hypothetical protein
MSKLCKLLVNLHKVAPLKPLKAMIEEVDQDLVHIKINMADHHLRHSTWGRDVFAASVTADQSSSARMVKETRSESERWERDKKARSEISSKTGGEQEVKESKNANLIPDSLGSDVDPPSVRIQQSIRLVERWIRSNAVVMAASRQKELDNRSMVSVIGGGIKERPIIDVGISKVSSLGSWTGRSSTPSSSDLRPY